MSLLKRIFGRKEKKEISTNKNIAGKVDDFQETKIFHNYKRKFEEVKEAMAAILKVTSGSEQGLCVDLLSARINIGRMPESDIVITDMGVSRLHAFIITENGRHILYDGKSTNGTYVNSLRITKHILHHGDFIKVGSTVITYELQ